MLQQVPCACAACRKNKLRTFAFRCSSAVLFVDEIGGCWRKHGAWTCCCNDVHVNIVNKCSVSNIGWIKLHEHTSVLGLHVVGCVLARCACSIASRASKSQSSSSIFMLATSDIHGASVSNCILQLLMSERNQQIRICLLRRCSALGMVHWYMVLNLNIVQTRESSGACTFASGCALPIPRVARKPHHSCPVPQLNIILVSALPLIAMSSAFYCLPQCPCRVKKHINAFSLSSLDGYTDDQCTFMVMSWVMTAYREVYIFI